METKLFSPVSPGSWVLKSDSYTQSDWEGVGLGVIFNQLWEKMTASKHTKKWYT